MTGKAETITREEAGKACIEVGKSLRSGVLNEIQSLHRRLFDVALIDGEFEPVWTMAGDYLTHIIAHLNDTLDDIEAGRFLPRQTGCERWKS